MLCLLACDISKLDNRLALGRVLEQRVQARIQGRAMLGILKYRNTTEISNER